jgi:hypothetical protein
MTPRDPGRGGVNKFAAVRPEVWCSMWQASASVAHKTSAAMSAEKLLGLTGSLAYKRDRIVTNGSAKDYVVPDSVLNNLSIISQLQVLHEPIFVERDRARC